jgi:hypothetical protein
MREERSRMAVSIAVRLGDWVLRGRMARASWARRVGRRAEEMCGREGVSDIKIELLEDGDDSGSKRAERMAESLGVSCEVGIVVVVVIISEGIKGLSTRQNSPRSRNDIQKKQDILLIDLKEARFYPQVSDEL